MNDSSRLGEADQALLSANATRPYEQGAEISQMPPGGQGAGGSGTSQPANVIASSLNSSQGSQEGSAFSGGVVGGNNQSCGLIGHGRKSDACTTSDGQFCFWAADILVVVA
jgi:hypothetical protein